MTNLVWIIVVLYVICGLLSAKLVWLSEDDKSDEKRGMLFFIAIFWPFLLVHVLIGSETKK